MAARLAAAFVDRWLARTDFPGQRRAEAIDLVSLMVSPEAEDGAYRLRVSFGFTGESWWLPDWGLDEGVATAFVTKCAGLAAAWVETERRHYGPTAWD